MSNKKKTINTNYEELIEIVKNANVSDEVKAEKVAFLEGRIEVNTKKNASGGEKKLTPTQVANKGIAKAIFDFLKTSGKSLTISAMIKEIPACADLSNQKINGILIREYNSEKYPNNNPLFVRTEEKGVAYFKANPDYVAEVEGE